MQKGIERIHSFERVFYERNSKYFHIIIRHIEYSII
jgi:hypothetical protein